jgi:hypothetical protein
VRSGETGITGQRTEISHFEIVLRSPTLRAGSQFRISQFEIFSLWSMLFALCTMLTYWLLATDYRILATGLFDCGLRIWDFYYCCFYLYPEKKKGLVQ